MINIYSMNLYPLIILRWQIIALVWCCVALYTLFMVKKNPRLIHLHFYKVRELSENNVKWNKLWFWNKSLHTLTVPYHIAKHQKTLTLFTKLMVFRWILNSKLRECKISLFICKCVSKSCFVLFYMIKLNYMGLSGKSNLCNMK